LGLVLPDIREDVCSPQNSNLSPSPARARSPQRATTIAVEELFGRDLLDLPEPVLEQYIEQAFHYWRKRGFPFPSLDKDASQRALSSLMRVGSGDLSRALERPSMVGFRIVNAFHPQMWSARVRGRSPLQTFHDDRVLRKSLRRAITMWPGRRCWSPHCIRMLMGLQNRSRVANFRPTVARSLIAHYTPEGGAVLDFAAGFGGRLLGALTLPVTYTGIDPARLQIVGSRKMAASLAGRTHGRAHLHQGCAEDRMKKLPSKSFDLVFSSPPYFNLEKYSSDTTQSRLRYPQYESWKQGFLLEVLTQSRRVLKEGGRLAINVGNLQRYPVADDTLAIGRSLFGDPETIHYLCMSSNPADKARSGRLMRQEPIFIFRK
jgi:SAM-dependent methyltransferase